MIIIQSKINPNYSVNVRPLKQYAGGNGFYFFLTTDKNKHFTGLELKRLAGDNVFDELWLKASAAWAGKDYENISI